MRSSCAADVGMTRLQLHVPYSYGWSIIALTALVKLATYPLTKTQVRAANVLHTVLRKSRACCVAGNKAVVSYHAS